MENGGTRGGRTEGQEDTAAKGLKRIHASPHMDGVESTALSKMTYLRVDVWSCFPGNLRDVVYVFP